MDKKKRELNETKKMILDNFIKELDKGELPWEKDWQTFVNSPKNLITNKQYDGQNAFLLSMPLVDKSGYKLNDPNDKRYLTFVQAVSNGYKLKKGSKSIPIVKYDIYDKKTKAKFNPNTLNGMTEEQARKYVKDNVRAYTKTFNVFNVNQLDETIKKPPKAKKYNKNWKEQAKRAEELINKSEAKIKNKEQDRAYYSLTTDSIMLPLKKQFKSEDAYLATAFHEMSHSTGAKNRLNRKMGGAFGSNDYAREELVAEFGSLFIAPEVGVKNDSKTDKNHVAYIQSWRRNIKSDPKYLFDAINQGALASDYIKTYDKSPRVKNKLQADLKRKQALINEEIEERKKK